MAKELHSKHAGTFGLGSGESNSTSVDIKEALSCSTTSIDSTCKESVLRKGKWTTEEEDYATKIISLFNRGLLPIGAGTTLRSYLSDKLHCDPMRITKKFAGASCIGKQVFQPCTELFPGDHPQLEMEELSVLEITFYRRVGDRSGSGLGEDMEFPNAPTSSSSRAAAKHSGLSVKWNREECQIGTSSSLSPTSSYRSEFPLKVKREMKLGGMRSVASAPDLSQLKRMHAILPLKGPGLGDTTKPKSQKRGLQTGSFKRNQRSQSVMNFMDFERYVSDDSAAGDLLLQFALRVGKTQQDEGKAAVSDDEERDSPVSKSVRLSYQDSCNRGGLLFSRDEGKGRVFGRRDLGPGLGGHEKRNQGSMYLSLWPPTTHTAIEEERDEDADGEEEEEEEAPFMVYQSNLQAYSSTASLQQVGCAFGDEEGEGEGEGEGFYCCAQGGEEDDNAVGLCLTESDNCLSPHTNTPHTLYPTPVQ